MIRFDCRIIADIAERVKREFLAFLNFASVIGPTLLATITTNHPPQTFDIRGANLANELQGRLSVQEVSELGEHMLLQFLTAHTTTNGYCTNLSGCGHDFHSLCLLFVVLHASIIQYISD